MSNIRNVNAVVVSGNLTTDPEFRQISEKFAVTRLRVATSRRVYSSQSGQYEDKPVYLTVEVLGGQAKPCAEHLSKGSGVTVHGEIDYAEWQAKDGGKRSEVRVVVDQREGGTVVFTGGRPQQNRAQATAAPAAQAMVAPQPVAARPAAPQPVAFPPQVAPATAPAAAAGETPQIPF